MGANSREFTEQRETEQQEERFSNTYFYKSIIKTQEQIIESKDNMIKLLNKELEQLKK